jgi:hypothetical protein
VATVDVRHQARLVMDAWGRDGITNYVVIDDVADHLQHLGDDRGCVTRRSAGRAVGSQDDRGRHARQQALERRDRVVTLDPQLLAAAPP